MDQSPEHHEPHDHDRGLAFDLGTLLERRRVLKLLGGSAVLAIVAGCGSGDDDAASSTTGSSGTTASTGTTGSTGTAGSTTASSGTTAATASTTCDVIPDETAGPFPGDGTNGPNVLTETGVVRSDITASFGSSTTVAEGIPLTIDLTVVDTANGCSPYGGAAVYLWHCDREGRYSLYDQEISNENYLRGVQEADADGVLRFTSIFPACYSGRWPHIHFEVYATLDDATSGANAVATSQIAFPEDVSSQAYATAGYEQSVSNFAQVSLDSDMVFSDGVSQQTPTVSGDATGGYTIALTVPV